MRALGDRSVEASTLHNIAANLVASVPTLAVPFEKQAVNVLQSIRRDNQGLSKELRSSYEKSIESYYRSLADLLVSLSRFAEAEEVLDLLKQKESFDYIRRDAIADMLRSIAPSDKEEAVLKRYDEIVDRIVGIGQRKAELLAKRSRSELSSDELAESGHLDADLDVANTVLNHFLTEEEKAFAPGTALAKQTADLRQATGVQKTLQKLGPSSVAIYTLAADDRYVAMLVTAGARKAYSTKITLKDLNQKLFAFRQALQNPAANPVPAAQELYRILLPEGLGKDLDRLANGGKSPLNVMWSLTEPCATFPSARCTTGNSFWLSASAIR